MRVTGLGTYDIRQLADLRAAEHLVRLAGAAASSLLLQPHRLELRRVYLLTEATVSLGHSHIAPTHRQVSSE